MAQQGRDVIRKKDDTLRLKDLALDQCLKTEEADQAAVEQKDAQLHVWYRNPVVMGLLGVAAGSLAAVYFKR